MGYSVNPVASGLKRGQTSSIGLIAVMSYWYSGAVTSGADRVAAAHNYDFVVMNAVGGIDREVLIQRARRLGQRVDGALAIDISEGELLEELIAALGVPVVTIGCQSPSVSSVLVDNHEIARLAAVHIRSATSGQPSCGPRTRARSPTTMRWFEPMHSPLRSALLILGVR